MSKTAYLDLMEQVVSAYSEQQIEDYIEKVRQRGVWEHGFPRLGANIGILIANGKLLHWKERFVQIMDLCSRDLPIPAPNCEHRGNDFSVKELCWCLLELEKTDLFPTEDLTRWKNAIAAVDPVSCYHCISPVPPERIGNWAAFNAASEQIRNAMGLAETALYIDNQVASQMFSFEENGMYRDPHEPMVYDTVTRLQLANVLYFGYEGQYKEQLIKNLRKAAKLTLSMQSVTGELAFGGRSNQFLHNEAHIAAIFEYEAHLCKQDGDLESAGVYKAAANLALSSIRNWLEKNPCHHIKNYYPIYSMTGCEKYAYYDKYMVTTASMLYNAYLFADDTIVPTVCPAESKQNYTFQTGPWFHKLFCKQDEYFAELEYEANPQYDASGIGRIHRRGAPSALCLSVPVSESPKFRTDEPNPHGMSICPGLYDGSWHYALTPESKYTIRDHGDKDGIIDARWDIKMPDGAMIQQRLIMDDGITIRTESNGMTGLMLPAFEFDGANETAIEANDTCLTVHYHGWCCCYRTDGHIVDTGNICTNRNGKYRVYKVNSKLLHIEIDERV